MGHIIAVCQLSGIFPMPKLPFLGFFFAPPCLISSALTFSPPGDLLFFHVLIISHTLSFVGVQFALQFGILLLSVSPHHPNIKSFIKILLTPSHYHALFFIYTFSWLPLRLFLFLCIYSRPFIQHFDSGFISFFHLYLAFLINPIIALLPFFISHHLTNNRFRHFLSFFHLFSRFLILIILLLTIFSNPLLYFSYIYPHNFLAL